MIKIKAVESKPIKVSTRHNDVTTVKTSSTIVESKPIKVSTRHNDVTTVKTSSTIVEVTKDVERYEGSYRVIPKAHADQTLLTRNKYLSDDVKVSQVPYFEVSNTKGQTVYIASEV